MSGWSRGCLYLALERAGADELVVVVPLLQRVALARSTRAALRRRRDVLPTLRQRLLAAVPGAEVIPVRLERIRLRSLVTLVATVAAAYLLAGELARVSLGHVLRAADIYDRAMAIPGDVDRRRSAFAGPAKSTTKKRRRRCSARCWTLIPRHPGAAEKGASLRLHRAPHRRRNQHPHSPAQLARKLPSQRAEALYPKRDLAA